MVKIKLLGELGRKFGREFDLQIDTPIEAIRAIGCQVRGFLEYLEQSSNNGVGYQLVTTDPFGLTEEQLGWYVRGEYLIIAPRLELEGGVFRIIAGVALVGLALAVPGGVFGVSATTIGLMGASLILGGISQLLTPKPKATDSKKDDSFLIDRAAETGRQGSPVPIWIGECYIQDLTVLSSSLTVNEYVVTPPAAIAPPTPPAAISENDGDNLAGTF